MTLLSIIIPNYNYGRFFDRLFNSLKSQSLSLDDVEIILADDGSTDNSVTTAAHWKDNLKCKNFEILSLKHCGHPGPVRNHGLKIAEGKYILTLDPDDVLDPAYLSCCIGKLESNASIDLIYTDYIVFRAENKYKVQLPDFSPVQLRTQNTLSPTAVYRSSILKTGVSYRDNTMYEDWDYWIQILMHGAKFLHLPVALYSYLIHDSNFSNKAIVNDGPSKAAIVLNNPDFFHPEVQIWARDHLRKRFYAPSFTRGIIPRPSDVEQLQNSI